MVLGSEFTAGINIQMTENVVARLEAIEAKLGPVTASINKMNEALGGVGNLRGVNKSLNQMSQNLDKINSKSGGINNVKNHITSLGNSAATSERKIGLLGKTLGGLGATLKGVLGLAGIYAGAAGIVGGIKEGGKLDTQLQGLSIAGFNQQQIARTREMATTLPGQKNMLISPEEVVRSVQLGYAITRNRDEAMEMPAIMGRFVKRVKEIGGKAGQMDEASIAEALQKISEQVNARTPAKVMQWANMLAKMEASEAGQINLTKLSQDIFMTRSGKWGADPTKLLTSLAMLQTEAAGGVGSSGGRQGGSMYQAAFRSLVQGAMPAAMAKRFAEYGLVEGFDKADADAKAAKAGHGRAGRRVHRTRHVVDGSGATIEREDGYSELIYHGGRKEPKGLLGDELKQFVVKNLTHREEWMKDPAEAFIKYAIPAIEKHDKLGQGGFWNLTPGQQVLHATDLLGGGNVRMQDFITFFTELKEVRKKMQEAIAAAPGLDDKLPDYSEAFNVAVGQLGNAFKAFQTRVFGNRESVEMFIGGMDRMGKVLALAGPAIEKMGKSEGFKSLVSSFGSITDAIIKLAQALSRIRPLIDAMNTALDTTSLLIQAVAKLADILANGLNKLPGWAGGGGGDGSGGGGGGGGGNSPGANPMDRRIPGGLPGGLGGAMPRNNVLIPPPPPVLVDPATFKYPKGVMPMHIRCPADQPPD